MTPSIVCFKWRTKHQYRSEFGPETVNTLRDMVARHYPLERFICVTDDPSGIAPGIEIVPLWNDHAHLSPPQGFKNPSCYRRLKAYSAEAREWFGDRFVMMDLDMVAVRDLRPLFDRPEDFVIYGDTNPHTFYNGGLVLMTAGCRRQVWETFDPKRSPAQAKAAQQFGSDQAWISFCLGPREAKWTKADGVYSFRNELQHTPHLPADARLVNFHGRHDPWTMHVQQSHPWVREHYQRDRIAA